jgi:heme exporter protein B
MRAYLRVVGLIFRKDFKEELRRKENLSSSFFFAFLSLVLFNFALDPTLVDLRETGSGLLWLLVLFAGSIFMGNSFRKETENGTLQALLLSPANRSAIFLGKFLVNFCFLTVLEILLWFFAFVLLDIRPGAALPSLALVWVLVTVGYAALGTLFAALIAQVYGGQVLYPILLFPVLIPLFMAAAALTSKALAGGDVLHSPWLSLVAAFDMLFFTASLFLFDCAVEE